MTKITGLTFHQAAEMRQIVAPPGRTLIVTATTLEAPDMEPPELIALVELHKQSILDSADRSRRGRAAATSSVLRKLRRLQEARS